MGQVNTACRVTKTGVFGVLEDELSTLGKQNTEGLFTTTQMSAATGHTRTWCNAKLRMLIDSGRVEYAGRIPQEAIDGKTCYVPAYRLKSDG